MDLLNAHARQPAQSADRLLDPLAVFADVEAVHRALFDRGVVAALGVAMRAQDVQLVRDLGRGKQVAGVGVARDQAQRLLLAAPADDDARVRSTETLRRIQRTCEVVVPAVEWLFIAAPHLQDDLQRFVQTLEAFFDRWKGDAQAATLVFVPASADAQPGAPA